jgi:alpha-N-arabinofuranosidase
VNTTPAAWGVVDPNTFGTDEFVAWCRLVGCEPCICTNPGDGTPEEMWDWVEYCNGNPAARPTAATGPAAGVRFWSIGNENWSGHEIGAKSPAEWGPLVRRSAELMRAVDPDLTLLAAATPNRVVPRNTRLTFAQGHIPLPPHSLTLLEIAP